MLMREREGLVAKVRKQADNHQRDARQHIAWSNTTRFPNQGGLMDMSDVACQVDAAVTRSAKAEQLLRVAQMEKDDLLTAYRWGVRHLGGDSLHRLSEYTDTRQPA